MFFKLFTDFFATMHYDCLNMAEAGTELKTTLTYNFNRNNLGFLVLHVYPSSQPLFPPLRPGLRCHPFKALQGPSRRLRRKWSLKNWNRLPSLLVTVPIHSSVNLVRLGRNCLVESSSPPHPFFTLSPFYAIPTPNALSFIIVLAF